jgi:hypothetical protein
VFVIDADGRRRRARLAALARHHPDQLAQFADERRRLKVEALERRIRTALGSDPALSTEQRADLAALLLNGDGDAA